MLQEFEFADELAGPKPKSVSGLTPPARNLRA
jgi:hypothetical protein